MLQYGARAINEPGPITQTVLTGTASNDIRIGGASDDTFNMVQGGNDTVKGHAGSDVFEFGAAFTAADTIDGGPNPVVDLEISDRLFLTGDYSTEVVFGSTTLTGVEAIILGAGHDYNLTTHDSTIASDKTLLIRGNNLLAGDRLTVDGSLESDGHFQISGHPGVDDLMCGSGNDQFFFEANCLRASDRIIGGGGFNSITLIGATSVVFGPDTVKNIDHFFLHDGHDYSLTMHDANLFFGLTMTIYGDSLTTGTLTFDGSRETDGQFYLLGGTRNDTLIGGRLNDIFQGNGGADTLTGGPGDDTLGYTGVAESTGNHYDTVIGFDFRAADLFQLDVTVSGVDGAVNAGRLTTARFDKQLAGVIDGTHLGAHHAVLYTPDLGGLAGNTFLIVDANGTSGYQAGEDYVFLLSGADHLGNLNAADFI